MNPHDAWHPEGPLDAETISPWSVVLEILMMCNAPELALTLFDVHHLFHGLDDDGRPWDDKGGLEHQLGTPTLELLSAMSPLFLLWGWCRAPWTWRVGMEWLWMVCTWSLIYILECEALISPYLAFWWLIELILRMTSCFRFIYFHKCGLL